MRKLTEDKIQETLDYLDECGVAITDFEITMLEEVDVPEEGEKSITT